MKNEKTVDGYIAKHEQWKEGLATLRKVMLKAGLEETIKWGGPVYTWSGKNIIGLGAFKSHMGIWFFQGALLQDTRGKLKNAQEGRTKAMRQWRFESGDEIDEKLVMTYVKEAIENQKAGKEIKADRKKKLVIPKELKEVIAGDSKLGSSFEALSLSKKREFAEYIAEAKREDTKEKRLEKIIPMILEGNGLHDKYRK